MRFEMSAFAAPLAAALAWAGAACTEAGPEPGRLEAATDTVDGVPRLTYPETRAAALGWRLDTVAVLGGFESAGEGYQFDLVAPGGVAGDVVGNLYVLDGAGKRVLGYDATGRFLGAWGREGGGPGELAGPGGLAVGPGGILWLPDDGNRRVTLIHTGTDAEPGSIPLAENAGAMGGDLALTEDGLFGVLSSFRFVPGEDFGPPPLTLVHMTMDGTYDDTLWTAERPHMDQVEARAGNRMMMMLIQQAFAPGFYWERFSDGGFAVAAGPEYEIHLLDVEGNEVRRIRRDPPARTPTDADIEAERQRQRDREPPGNIPGAEQLMERRLEALTFADRVPRITGLALDTQDRLWVGVSEDVPGETERIDVYDREGRLLGELPGREALPVEFYGDGLAADLTADDLDVQQLVISRLIETG